jgi:hypothetical protein
MAEVGPELRDALAREDWLILSEWVVGAAEIQIRKLCWRGRQRGVLPDGCDAQSIANEAVAQLFGGNCRLRANYTREELHEELQRLIHQQVNRLHQRKENRLVRNCRDLARVRDAAGERLKVEEAIPDEAADPSTEAVGREREERLAEFRRTAMEYLADDREAVAIFACLCNGVKRRGEIAMILGMTPAEVKNARKRMERMLKGLSMNGGSEICDEVREERF